MDLSPDAMGAIMDAWGRGDDEAAREALRDALDDEYAAGFDFDDLDVFEIQRHT